MLYIFSPTALKTANSKNGNDVFILYQSFHTHNKIDKLKNKIMVIEIYTAQLSICYCDQKIMICSITVIFFNVFLLFCGVWVYYEFKSHIHI